MPYLRSKFFDLLLLLWTVLLAALIPVLALARQPSWVRKVSRIWSLGIIFGLKWVVGLTFSELGRENIPEGPVIIVCNHQSSWETLVFNILIPDVCIVLKESLYRYPIFGWYLKHSPMIAIDRSQGYGALRTIVKGAGEAVSTGRSILIFPEGTRQAVYASEPFNRGVAMLYKSLNVPVVPTALNSGAFWSPDGFMKYSGHITVSYLNPIQPGLCERDFMAKLESDIKNEKDRLVRELGIDVWLWAMG